MSDCLQSRIDVALKAPPGLGEQEQQQWLRMRRRVGSRHAAWRTGLPAIAELFDDEAHRAKALAGNLATELGDVLRGTAEIEPAAVLVEGRPAAWGIDCFHGWLAALEEPGVAGMGDDRAREVYVAELVQLVEREHGRAVEYARSLSADGGEQGQGAIARAVGWFGARIRGFFNPV